MLSLGHILLSDLLVTNLFVHSLPGIILVYLAAPFYTEGVVVYSKVLEQIIINGQLKSECTVTIQEQ